MEQLQDLSLLGNDVHRKMIVKYFAFSHLPEHLAAISAPFYSLAIQLAYRVNSLEADPAETTVALRKLLEAKDAAVRAAL